MPTQIYPVIRDKSNVVIAVLQNAYSIGYNAQRNALWTCSFSLPLNDPKVAHVKPKYFVELYDHERRIGMFIVNPKKTVKNESTNEITYECEHVLSLLHSDVLFRYHQYTNLPTAVVLSGLLANQEVAHWNLGTVAFTRYFSYSWENEDSLLNAIMSVPKSFDQPFTWTWDDATYPFTLNLVAPSDEVKGLITAGKNLRGIEITEDPTNVVTRIYPLGFGEGVNQLTIAEVNGGQLYLRDATAEADYGVHKRVWVDSRFENAESLKASAQAILDKYKTPLRSVAVDCVDYSTIDPYTLSQYSVGDVLRVHDQDTQTDELIRLERVEKGDIYGAPYDMQLELGDVRESFGGTFADLAKKQLVNDTYSQGATNIDSRDFADNCDANFPAVIRFPIPDDVVNINEMTLTFETTAYRAYSKAIQGGGGLVSSTASGGGSTKTSSSGGGSTQTSSSGGGTTESTTSGGGTTQSSTAGGDHDHIMFVSVGGGSVAATPKPYFAGGAEVELKATANTINTWSSSGDHAHSVTIPSHSHNVTIPNHSHSITIPAHTHTTDIPAHSHDITIPEHSHGIDYGIFEFGTLPTAVQITIDGTVLPLLATSGESIDLVPYLQKDAGGKISRGRYAEIKLAPNNLARINATVTSRLFIQSRIGGNY